MTTPCERAAALIAAGEILEALAYHATYRGESITPASSAVRRLAARVLVDYPTGPEVARWLAEIQAGELDRARIGTPRRLVTTGAPLHRD